MDVALPAFVSPAQNPCEFLPGSLFHLGSTVHVYSGSFLAAVTVQLMGQRYCVKEKASTKVTSAVIYTQSVVEC